MQIKPGKYRTRSEDVATIIYFDADVSQEKSACMARRIKLFHSLGDL